MTMINDSGVRTLGSKIRIARAMADIKQGELARAVGVSRSAVSQWENGETEPSALKMFAIAQATNQPLGWFAEGLDVVCAWRDSNPQPSDPYPTDGAAGFWTDARALSLAILWRQVEPDAESAHAGTVA